MDRFYSMQIFSRVAEMTSFTKAAISLGMPKASVSNYIQQLETQVGTRLFHRTTRSVQLTQDGILFYERCKDLLVDVEELETMFHENTKGLSGRIRIDTPVRLARDLIIPKLQDFIKLHPNVEIELSSTDRKVDVIQEGFDCVLRIGNLNNSELIARSLGEMKIVNCVSPSYIKKHGRPLKLADLSNHFLVHYASTLGMKPFGFEYLENGKYKTLKMNGSITVNSTDAYQAACLSGFGIIQAPEFGVREDLKKGLLIEVLRDLIAEPMPISLLYPNRRNVSRRLKVFMDWLDFSVRNHIK